DKCLDRFKEFKIDDAELSDVSDATEEGPGFGCMSPDCSKRRCRASKANTVQNKITFKYTVNFKFD
ncbi:MAG: hypothetical protein AB2784_18040, partial [Candidatus Thiodiazotropha endolucinida]